MLISYGYEKQILVLERGKRFDEGKKYHKITSKMFLDNKMFLISI